ncbi:MAG TPA: hypothetical protein VGQ55_07155 [Pyrinomonadaceae bacterium]|nr:hypothetical protein [Pyrinomonadaceae bacterium]
MKPFTTIAVVVFAIICTFHILRLFLGWEAKVNNLDIPLWVSVVGALFSGLMALMLWRENK